LKSSSTRRSSPDSGAQTKWMGFAVGTTQKRRQSDDHNQLRRHLADFVDAYNFGRRLTTLKGLTPFASKQPLRGQSRQYPNIWELTALAGNVVNSPPHQPRRWRRVCARLAGRRRALGNR
jgi:hypothetical protein